MRLLIQLALFLFVIQTVQADIIEWDNSVNLENNEFNVTIIYDEPVTTSDYFAFARISNVEVYADGTRAECMVSEKEIGMSIVCSNLNARKITYKFNAFGLITTGQELIIFNYKFPVTQQIGIFTVTIKLPIGLILVDKARLQGTSLNPVEPADGEVFSDGRNIFIKWVRESPAIGSSIDSSIIYETLEPRSNTSLIIFLFIFIVVVLGTILYIRRVRFHEILPVLTDDERKVMQMLLKEGKGVDQRRIVKELDLSKAKASRLIQELSERGLVEKIRKGRSNIIKTRKRGKITQKEEIEKKR